MDEAPAGLPTPKTPVPGGGKNGAGKRGNRTRKQLSRKAARLERALAVSGKADTKTKRQVVAKARKQQGKGLWAGTKVRPGKATEG